MVTEPVSVPAWGTVEVTRNWQMVPGAIVIPLVAQPFEVAGPTVYPAPPLGTMDEMVSGWLPPLYKVTVCWALTCPLFES